MVRLGDYFKPVRGVLPSGIVSADVISNTATTYTSQAEYKWSDAKLHFNIQGQKWERDIRASFFGPQTYGGCRNVATPRVYSAQAAGLVNNHYQHVTEFEFLFTGSRFSIAHWNSGGNNSGTEYGGNIQVYIEHAGGTWKLAENPLIVTRTSGDMSYRNITFAAPYCGRIRVVMGAAAFFSIRTDGTSIVEPAPPRLFGIADGDSYFEGTQALAADNVTGWFTYGIIDYLFEMTGMTWARRAQGATGFFVNGVGQIFDDTIGSVTSFHPALPFIQITVGGVSRTSSASRRGWMTNAVGAMAARGKSFIHHAGEDFGQPLGLRPLVYLLNGTWNDASSGGVTEQQMYDRAGEVYDWTHAQDPHCTIVHVSPEPFDDTLFGNAIGPPRVDDDSYPHVQGQIRAAGERPRTYYINGFGPDAAQRWWTGHGPSTTGTQGVPTNSQQAQLVSKRDGIHATKVGNRYYAAKIVEQLAEIMVPAARVNGLV
jgi:hypothetical protein